MSFLGLTAAVALIGSVAKKANQPTLVSIDVHTITSNKRASQAKKRIMRQVTVHNYNIKKCQLNSYSATILVSLFYSL